MNKKPCIILCTFTKGGAGKTTVAAHITGMLVDKSIEQVLLIDCDGRADSWEFFAKTEVPDQGSSDAWKKLPDGPHVWWNPPQNTGDRFKTLNARDYEKYGYVVIDTNSPPEDGFTILKNHLPDIVLVPIANAQSHAIRHFLNFFHLLEYKIKRVRDSGKNYNPIIKVVPLGVEIGELKSKFKKHNINIADFRDLEIEIVSPMRYLAKEVQESLENQTFMWENPGLEDTKDYFYKLIF
jgi:chromosome partitioning protein